MQRVEEIRRRRERAFYMKRMAGNKARAREADRKLVAENQHLLPPNMRDLKLTEKAEADESMEVASEEEEEMSEEETVKVKVPAKGRKVKAGDRMDID